MAWIKSDETLSQHPKVDLLAEKLSLHPAQVVGHLHYLWWWALSYADTGDLTRYKSMISKASNYDGDNDFFIDNLVSCGWLDRTKTSLKIHDWEEYHGALLETRNKNTERKRKERAIKEEEKNDPQTKAEKAALFQALVEVWLGKPYTECKPDITTDARSRINRAVKVLAQHGATPEEIERRGFNYFVTYGDRPTPQALSGNWPQLDQARTDKDRKQAKKQVTSAHRSFELTQWVNSDD